VIKGTLELKERILYLSVTALYPSKADPLADAKTAFDIDFVISYDGSEFEAT